jgi:hypothetical protein
MAEWRMPPQEWFEAQPPDLTVRECIRRYYELHPEHKPPPEVIKALKSQTAAAAAISIPEQRAEAARQGVPRPLIDYLLSDAVVGLSAAEKDVIVKALEKQARRQNKIDLATEYSQIASMFERLCTRLPQKTAEDQVMSHFGCGRTKLYKAIKDHERRRGLIPAY